MAWIHVGIAAEFLATLVLQRRHLIMQIWLSYYTKNYNFLSNLTWYLIIKMSFNYSHPFVQLLHLYYYIIALLSKGGGRRRSNRLVTSESSIACKKEGNIKGSENETKTQNNGNVSSIFHIVMSVDHGDFQDKIGIVGSIELLWQ